jgi:protein translocase, SecG subunit
MKEILTVIHIAVAVTFSLLVMSQSRGQGFTANFGTTKNFRTKKRGAEKFISNLTTVLAVCFVLLSLSFMFVE